ncbi:hypothetical protein HKCCSP123_14065 [Rhodobacterales bacterium HKCCSP123]|nr:hypothetical protein [Rhodobacterales bacterium HKCCSP123]
MVSKTPRKSIVFACIAATVTGCVTAPTDTSLAFLAGNCSGAQDYESGSNYDVEIDISPNGRYSLNRSDGFSTNGRIYSRGNGLRYNAAAGSFGDVTYDGGNLRLISGRGDYVASFSCTPATIGSPTLDSRAFSRNLAANLAAFELASSSGSRLAVDALIEKFQAGELTSDSVEYFLSAILSGSSATGPQGFERLDTFLESLQDPRFASEFSRELGVELGQSLFEGAMTAVVTTAISETLADMVSPQLAQYFDALSPSVSLISALNSGSAGGVAGVATSIWIDNVVDFTRFGVELAEAERSGRSFDQDLATMSIYEMSYIESLATGTISGPAFPAERQGDPIPPSLEAAMLDGLSQMPRNRESIVVSQEYLAGLQSVARSVGETLSSGTSFSTVPIMALE